MAGVCEVGTGSKRGLLLTPFLWNHFINTQHAGSKSPRRHWCDLLRCPHGLDRPVAASTVQRQTPVPRSRARSGRLSGEREAVASHHRCSCSKRRWRSGVVTPPLFAWLCLVRLSRAIWYDLSVFAPIVHLLAGYAPRAPIQPKLCGKYCMHGQLNSSQGQCGRSVDSDELLASTSQAAKKLNPVEVPLEV
jgi:hypothetical protein